MAFVHGKDSVITVATKELTSYVTDVAFNTSADVAETSVMGLDSKTYLPGLKDGTISITGRFDSTATSGPDDVLTAALGTSVAIEYGPEGSANGKIKASCNAICTAYNRTSPVGDIVAFSAEFQITGDVTEGTYSS